jgi:hypothetical protein
MASRLSIGAIKVNVGRNVLVCKNVSVGRKGVCVGNGITALESPVTGRQDANTRITRVINTITDLLKQGLRGLGFIHGV